MSHGASFDVVIAGASIAGCTAATFLGRRGLRVLVVERASARNAYKRVCTHFIQPCGTPTLRRLGVVERMEAAGAVRNSIHTYTPFGKVPHAIDEHGYNIRREKLDPLLREVAAGTRGVELRLGTAATSLVRRGERVVGVGLADGSTVHASLVVGADGRDSKVAGWARLDGRIAANNRFLYFAYFEGLPLVTGKVSQSWLLGPAIAYCLPNDEGITCAAVMPHKDRLPEFRRDLEKSFLSFWEGIPDAPDFRKATRRSPIMGMLEMPNCIRPASAAGIALVGDAAMTSDPVLGVGCGWALQTAEWLSDDVAAALLSRSPRAIDKALARYGRHHAARLRFHYELNNRVSLATPFNALDRFVYGASTRDPRVARAFQRLGARLVQPTAILRPRLLARALWAHRPAWLGGEELRV